jgi:hypothetical protein
LQLTGSATVNQNIASSQTSGNLQIGGTDQTTGAILLGGTSATGVINIGRSTGTQTITLGSGNVTTGSTRTINIGTNAAGNGISNVTIGRYSSTAAHSTNINGRDVLITGGASVQLQGGASSMLADTTADLYANTVASVNGVTGVNIQTTGGSYTTIGAVGDTQTLTVNHDTTNINSGITTIKGLLKQQTYTVATLPTGSVGSRSFVTNHRSATAYPIFGEVASATGTFGTFNVPVFHDGTSWRVG